MVFNRNKFISAVIAVLILSILFAFLGVYDSGKMSFKQGFLLWVSTISTGAVTGLLIFNWIFKGPLTNQHVAVQLISLSAIASIPVVLVLAAFSGGLTGNWPLYNWPLQYFLAFVIAIIINAGAYVTLKAAGWIPIKDLTDQSESPIRHFLKRLPVSYHRSELYALSSEDHYIRVHTDAGEELILMRLSDALRELIDADGLQTHRSWWVARRGIAKSVIKNGKYSLVLKSGTIVPISRSFSSVVKDAYFNHG